MTITNLPPMPTELPSHADGKPVPATETKQSQPTLTDLISEHILTMDTTPTRDTLSGWIYSHRWRYAISKNRDPLLIGQPCDYLYRIVKELMESIAELMRCSGKGFVILADKGGAGKTPTIAELASLAQHIMNTYGIGANGLFIEVNINNGTAYKWLDIRRVEGQLITDALVEPERLRNPKQMWDQLPRHKQTGLTALLSHQEGIQGYSNSELLARFETLYHAIRHNYHSRFCDTGNGLGEALNEIALITSDVACVVGFPGNPGSVEGIISTRQAYYASGYEDKIRLAPTIIAGTDPKETREDYFNYLYEATKQQIATERSAGDSPAITDADVSERMKQLGIAVEKIFLIRKSSYLGDDHIRVASVYRGDIGIATLIDLLRVLLYMYQLPSEDESVRRARIQQRYEELIQVEREKAGTKQDELSNEALSPEEARKRARKAARDLKKYAGSIDEAGVLLYGEDLQEARD